MQMTLPANRQQDQATKLRARPSIVGEPQKPRSRMHGEKLKRQQFTGETIAPLHIPLHHPTSKRGQNYRWVLGKMVD